MAGDIRLCGNEEQVHGRGQNGVTWHDEHGRILQKCSVECRKQSITAGGVLPKMPLEGGGLLGQHGGKRANRQPGIQIDAGQQRRVDTVYKNQSRCRLIDVQMRDVGGLHMRGRAKWMKRLTRKGSQAGETPGFVMCAGQCEGAHALQRPGAQGDEPVRLRRCRGFAGRQRQSSQ